MILSKKKVEVVSTGSIGLNRALGIGGFPKGRVIEIYGPESSGKTTIALHAIAESQKKGNICAFVDAEHALDTNYAKSIGADIDNLYLTQPSDGEQALEITNELVSSGAIDLIVIDSVAALVPRSELEGNMGDAQMGLQARLMSQALRKLTALMSRTKTTVIFINQLRSKIGVFFGNPETTTGGNALKFYASMRLDIRKTEVIRKGDEIIGNKVKVKVVKNKLAPPFKIVEFSILYGLGVHRQTEILELAINENIIKKSGSWYSYNDERIGQGLDKTKLYFRENPNVFRSIEKELLHKLGMINNNKSDAKTTENNRPSTYQ